MNAFPEAQDLMYTRHYPITPGITPELPDFARHPIKNSKAGIRKTNVLIMNAFPEAQDLMYTRHYPITPELPDFA